MATKRIDQFSTVTPDGTEYVLVQKQADLTYGKTTIATVSAAAAPVQSVAGKTGAVTLTKSDVSLGNVDNTSDASKPVSTAQAAAIALKENTITAGTTSQYYRGDKSFQTLNQDAVPSGTTNKAYTATEQTKLAAISGTNTGDETATTIKTKLGISTLSGSNTGDQDLSSYATTSSVTTGLAGKANTTHSHAESDVTGLVSDLAAKQATLVSGTNIKTVNGSTLLGSGDLVISGGTGGANALNPTAVKTTNYTAAANDFVPVDTTSGAVTISLPTAPANGTRFGAKLVVLGTGNLVTITRGGTTDVFNKTGGNTSVTLTLLNQGVQFQYYNGIWYGVAADIGLTALDARYTNGIPLSKTANYAQSVGDVLLLADATSGGFTLSLVSAVTATVGRPYYVKKIDPSMNEVILLPNGSQTIDGAPYQVLSSANNAVTLVSDGANWWLF